MEQRSYSTENSEELNRLAISAVRCAGLLFAGDRSQHSEPFGIVKH
jgi:hypothetical protein